MQTHGSLRERRVRNNEAQPRSLHKPWNEGPGHMFPSHATAPCGSGIQSEGERRSSQATLSRLHAKPGGTGAQGVGWSDFPPRAPGKVAPATGPQETFPETTPGASPGPRKLHNVGQPEGTRARGTPRVRAVPWLDTGESERLCATSRMATEAAEETKSRMSQGFGDWG